MNILVIGCGDAGSQLANLLDGMGHQVSVVDRNPELVANLSEDFSGMFTAGIPIDQDVLTHAGIEGCDVVVAVTGDDNINLMVAQLARDIFGVPQVISRVSDPNREEVFSSFGLSTICPTNLTVESIVAGLDNRAGHSEEAYFGSTRVAFEQMEIDRQYLGEFAEAIPLPKGYTLLGVLSLNGKLRLRGAGMQTAVHDGDVLVVARTIG
ncbi:MAG: TrkA family potassium uptake protein [Clostridiales bacterium]|nr:TrkA family potassium uptake protein [Clostridiales bacterium]